MSTQVFSNRGNVFPVLTDVVCDWGGSGALNRYVGTLRVRALCDSGVSLLKSMMPARMSKRLSVVVKVDKGLGLLPIEETAPSLLSVEPGP